MSETAPQRIEALEAQLGAWPSVRPPKGVDGPSLAAEAAWLEASIAFRMPNDLQVGELASELAQAKEALKAL